MDVFHGCFFGISIHSKTPEGQMATGKGKVRPAMDEQERPKIK